jgi:phosphoribosylformylglycinamidine synthase
VINALSKAGLAKCIHTIAKINNTDAINIGDFSKQRSALQQLWSKTSYEIVKLRDNPECAKEEFDAIVQDTLGLQTDNERWFCKISLICTSTASKPALSKAAAIRRI